MSPRSPTGRRRPRIAFPKTRRHLITPPWRPDGPRGLHRHASRGALSPSEFVPKWSVQLYERGPFAQVSRVIRLTGWAAGLYPALSQPVCGGAAILLVTQFGEFTSLVVFDLAPTRQPARGQPARVLKSRGER